jgi:hypothetical protein
MHQNYKVYKIKNYHTASVVKSVILLWLDDLKKKL